MSDENHKDNETHISDPSRRRFVEGSAAVAGVLALGGTAPLLSACSSEKVSGHLKVGVDGVSTTSVLDPSFATATGQFANVRTYASLLVQQNEEGEIVGSLAESWDSADAQTWVFKLKKGVEFHNGKSFSAEDVIATIDTIRSGTSKSPVKGMANEIEEIKVSGDGKHEITIKLKEPNADLPVVFNETGFAILPKDANRNDGIGTGPYKLEYYEPGVSTGFQRFENFFDADRKGFSASIEYQAIQDSSSRVNALKTGDIHLIAKIPASAAPSILEDDNLQLLRVKGKGHYTIPMDVRKEPFSNNDVRLALKYAVKREEMVEKILFGYGSVGNDQPIATSDQFYNSDVPQREYDPEKALFHLKKSGFEGPIPLHVSNAAFANAVSAAQLFSESAKQAGVDIKVIRTPEDGYWDKVWMQKSWSFSYWSGRPAAGQMFSIGYHPSSAWNETFWDNAAFNELFAEAKRTVDSDKRKKIYGEMQQIVADEGGTVIPIFNDYLDAASEDVKGYPYIPSVFGDYEAALYVRVEDKS